MYNSVEEKSEYTIGQSEDLNQRTDNTMAKRKKDKQRSTQHPIGS